jgi:hypothetical protein
MVELQKQEEFQLLSLQVVEQLVVKFVSLSGLFNFDKM